MVYRTKFLNFYNNFLNWNIFYSATVSEFPQVAFIIIWGNTRVVSCSEIKMIMIWYLHKGKQKKKDRGEGEEKKQEAIWLIKDKCVLPLRGKVSAALHLLAAVETVVFYRRYWHRVKLIIKLHVLWQSWDTESLAHVGEGRKRAARVWSLPRLRAINVGGCKEERRPVIPVSLATDSLTFFLDSVPYIKFRGEK